MRSLLSVLFAGNRRNNPRRPCEVSAVISRTFGEQSSGGGEVLVNAIPTDSTNSLRLSKYQRAMRFCIRLCTEIFRQDKRATMGCDFDVIVLGSGAGGGTFAHALSRAGKRVLVIERGNHAPANGPWLNEQTTLIDKKPYDDRSVCVNGTDGQLYIGGVVGGSTALYGAALMPERSRLPSRKTLRRGVPDLAGIGPSLTGNSSHITPRRNDSTVLLVLPTSSGHSADRKSATPTSPFRSKRSIASSWHQIRPEGYAPLPPRWRLIRIVVCDVRCAGFLCPTGAGRRRLICLGRGMAPAARPMW